MRALLLLFASAVVVLFPMTGHAASLSFSTTFETTGQSMWGSGGAFDYHWAKNATVNWNKSGSTGGVSCPVRIFGECISGYYGGEVHARTDGEIGLALGASVNAGSVDASVPATMNLTTPSRQIAPGSQFTVDSSYAWGAGTLNTTGPTVSAYTDLIFDVFAAGSARACVVGCASTGDITFINVDRTIELMGFNRNGDGKLRVLGSEMGFPVSTSIGSYAEITAQTPRMPNTSGTGVGIITASGVSQLADMQVDVTNVAAGLLGLPPLNGEIGVDWLAELEYTTLQLYGDFGLTVRQNFALNPLMTGRLRVAETGQVIPMNLSGPTPVTFPKGYSSIAVTPYYSFIPQLANSTSFCFDAGVGLNALALSLSVFGEGVFDLGPAYSTSAAWPCVGGTVDVYDSQFGLRGFTDFAGPSFTVYATPEPDVFVLTASGLIAILVGTWRRRR